MVPLMRPELLAPTPARPCPWGTALRYLPTSYGRPGACRVGPGAAPSRRSTARQDGPSNNNLFTSCKPRSPSSWRKCANNARRALPTSGTKPTDCCSKALSDAAVATRPIKRPKAHNTRCEATRHSGTSQNLTSGSAFLTRALVPRTSTSIFRPTRAATPGRLATS